MAAEGLDKRFDMSSPVSSFVVVPGGDHDLLIAQGLDGIEAGGFDGGVHPKEEAHAHGTAHGEHHGPERNGRRQSGHRKVDQQADAAAEQHPDDASRAGEYNSFGEELPDDVAAARADGFAHANLASALRDGHQHNVHHADAADKKPDTTHDANQNRHRPGDLTNLFGDRLPADYSTDI